MVFKLTALAGFVGYFSPFHAIRCKGSQQPSCAVDTGFGVCGLIGISGLSGV